jgi:ferredoxin
MTAAERKPDEKRIEKKNICFDIWNKYVALYFCGLCEDACPKDAVWLPQNACSIQLWREDFIYGKDRLVMPLDIAMQNAQLKTPTNVDNTNYLCVGAVTTSYCILTIFSRNHSALYLVICFHNSGSLSPVELSISRHCPYYLSLERFYFYSPSCWWTWIKKMRSTNPELQDWERSFHFAW